MREDLLKLKQLMEDLVGMFGEFPNPAVAFVGISKDKKYKKEKAVVDNGKLQEK